MSDVDLVESVRGGDVEAFTELYALHVGAVRLAIRDNVHEPEAVADAVQDTFARALERLDSLRDPGRFRPWLLSIARHVAIDQRRARQRATERDGGEANELEGDDPGPGELAELTELAELVDGCVGGLSPRDATLITLVTRLGLSPSEVAEAMDTTPGAAKVAVHRARRRLRDVLVLELLVRARGVPCEEFTRIRDTDDVAAAATHVRDCDRCQWAARRELELYGAGANDPARPDHSPSMRR